MSLVNVLEVFRSVGATLTGLEIPDEEQGNEGQASGGSAGYSDKGPDNASYPVYLFDIS